MLGMPRILRIEPIRKFFDIVPARGRTSKNYYHGKAGRGMDMVVYSSLSVSLTSSLKSMYETCHVEGPKGLITVRGTSSIGIVRPARTKNIARMHWGSFHSTLQHQGGLKRMSSMFRMLVLGSLVPLRYEQPATDVD